MARNGPKAVGVHDWDSDPIIEAAELHHAGFHREAIRILEGALAIDNRCIDAWGHLGLIAFNTRGPGPAAEFYQTGIAVGEASLPTDFDGVLAWGWIDNRPFLRCLHGLALCAWRQRRCDDAEAMFTARAWLDPSRSLSDLACLEPVCSSPTALDQGISNSADVHWPGGKAVVNQRCHGRRGSAWFSTPTTILKRYDFAGRHCPCTCPDPGGSAPVERGERARTSDARRDRPARSCVPDDRPR